MKKYQYEDPEFGTIILYLHPTARHLIFKIRDNSATDNRSGRYYLRTDNTIHKQKQGKHTKNIRTQERQNITSGNFARNPKLYYCHTNT